MGAKDNSMTMPENMERSSHLVVDKLHEDLLQARMGRNSKNITNKEAFMEVNNGITSKDEVKLIILTEIRMEMSTIGSHKGANKVEKLKERLKDEQKSSLWNLKGNKENTTNINDKLTANTKKE